MLKRIAFIAFVTLCAAGGWRFGHVFDGNPLHPKPLSGAPIEPLRITAAPGSRSGYEFDSQQNTAFNESACMLPATSAVTRTVAPVIYHWTDEQGGQHYGDRPPAVGDAALYIPQAASRLEYFNLSIEPHGKINEPYYRNHLTPQVYGIYQILGDLLGQQRLRKIDLNIALYPDRSSYLRHAQLVTGRNMSNTSGFYSSAINEAATYIGPSPEETLEVARHESTHVIVAGVLGRTPIWLNEGMAQYFALISIEGLSKKVSASNVWLRLARESLSRGYPRNLSALLSLDADTWRNDHQEAHYAVSWALLYFMMSSEKGKTSIVDLMGYLADHYCQPVDSLAFLADRYPGGIRRLETDFYKWLGDSRQIGSHYY